MNPERIEAAAKAKYDKAWGDGAFDDLSPTGKAMIVSEMRGFVSAWLEAGPPVYQEHDECGGTHELLTECGSFDFCGNESPCVVLVGVKSDG